MQTFNRILVAVDGSESSMLAVKTAAGLAKSVGAKLTILHVISFLGDGYSSGYSKTTLAERKAREKAEECLSLAREAADLIGVNSRSLIIEDLESPAWGIAEYAAKNSFDLVVTGTRGLRGFRRFITGSVAVGVLNEAPCSVLVVKGGGERSEAGARNQGVKTKLGVAEATESAGDGNARRADGNGVGSKAVGT